MKWVRFLTAVLACIGFATSSNADVVTTIYNTGQDNNHVVLAGNAIDPHYTLTSSADPAFPGPIARVVHGNNPVSPNGPWIANSATSRWISPRSDGGSEPAGTYVFHTTFNLTGFNPATAIINGQWTMDDHGLDLKLNNVSTGITRNDFGAHESFAPFQINSGFIAGINTLDFYIDNTFLPIGFRTEMILTATPVPEPASVLFLTVVGTIGVFRRLKPSRLCR